VTRPAGSLPRFTRGERWVHRSLGIVMGVLLITGAFLFFPDLGGLIGNRQVVSLTHEVSGWLLPIPLIGRATGSGCAAATGDRGASPSASSTRARSSTRRSPSARSSSCSARAW
jgi:hypothetical protein